MKIGAIRVALLAAILASIGMWVGVAAADAHAMPGALAMHAGHQRGASPETAAADDCAGDLASESHGGCCGAFTFGCCGACLLAPPSPTAAAPAGAPVFALALVEAPPGLPSGRLQRPPRLDV